MFCTDDSYKRKRKENVALLSTMSVLELIFSEVYLIRFLLIL